MDQPQDMMATPINKLPAPIITEKQPLGDVPVYENLAKEVAIPQQPNGGTNFQHMLQQQQQPPPQQQQPSQPPAFHPMTMMHPRPQQQYYQDDDDDDDDEPVLRRRVPPVRRAGPHESPRLLVPPRDILTTLKSKKLWALAAVLFAFVTWILPKTKKTLPFVVSPVDGRMTTPGLAAASAIVAIVFTIVSDMVLV